MVASGRVSNIQNDTEHDLNSLCAGGDGPPEVRAEEGQPAPPDRAAANIVSTSTAAQAGKADAMETELSRRRGTKRLPKPRTSDLLSREMMKQWNRRGQEARDSEPWPVTLCVLSYSVLTRFLWVMLPHVRSTRDQFTTTRRVNGWLHIW